MARSNFRFKFDQAGWARMQDAGGAVDQSVARAAGKVRDDSKRELTSQGRVNDGRLRQSINSERNYSRSDGVFYRVGSRLPYAKFQHDGTRGPIYPRRAKVLRFKPKGGSGFVFAKSVRGVSPSRFLTKALSRLTPDDFGTSSR